MTLQPQVFNIPTALVSSSIDNPAIIYVFFGLFTHGTLKSKCFQKSKFNARNTRAGNQTRDLSFRLTAPETSLCAYFVYSTENDVRISRAIFIVK